MRCALRPFPCPLRPAFVGALLCALLLAPVGTAGAREGRAGASPEAIDGAIAKLADPLARQREEGIRELVSLLPGARARILAVLPNAPWEVQAGLSRVLAEDGSDAAIRALLDVLTGADDAQAAAVFRRIVSDVATSSRLLATLRTDRARFGGTGEARAHRLDELHGLLLRAEVEDKFVARKSRSGSTGYYRGQYDNLKYARKQALEIVLHIAQDRALRIPGVYRTGRYRFLRPKPIEFWELRAMAVNAIGELALPEDEAALIRLEAYTLSLQGRVEQDAQSLRRRRSGPFRVSREELEEMQEDFAIEVGRFGDFLTAQYLIRRDEATEIQVRDYLYSVKRRYSTNFRFGPLTARNITATTLIRAGWYAEAIRVYAELLDDYLSSKSMAYYNIACAFASWSLEPTLSPDEQAGKRKQAMRSLELAVERGWTDIGWMDEDGDLDPIRDSPRYKQLLARIQRMLGLLPPK